MGERENRWEREKIDGRERKIKGERENRWGERGNRWEREK